MNQTCSGTRVAPFCARLACLRVGTAGQAPGNRGRDNAAPSPSFCVRTPGPAAGSARGRERVIGISNASPPVAREV